MSTDDPRATVARLLRAAGLTVAPDELAQLAEGYVQLRRQADRLYSAEFDEVEPAVVFDPAAE